MSFPFNLPAFIGSAEACNENYTGNITLFLASTASPIVKSNKFNLPVGCCIASDIMPIQQYKADIFEKIYLMYLDKISVAKNCGMDFILFKEQDNLYDMRAGVLAAKAIDIPALVIMNVNKDGMTESGTNFISALITLQAIGVSSFGIYCTDGIEEQIQLIEQAFQYSNIPLIACFDSDKCTKEQAIALAQNGATVFIDRSVQKELKYIDDLSGYGIVFDKNAEKDNYATAISCETFFLSDTLELSEPIYCGLDMTEKIISLDNESINAVYIFLNSTDDAVFLAENAEMSRLPLVIHTDDAYVLECALKYYPGRLIVDCRCEIDKNVLNCLTDKYGAILY